MRNRIILLGVWLVLIAGCVVAMAAFPLFVLFAPRRAWLIAIATDDMGNEVIGGELGRTISSHAAHAQRDGKVWGCVLCGLLNWLNPGHCARALKAHDQNLR